ncbi:MAG TPA: efflux RND transporter periplasmic adaptor subunit, partial [Xanthobacteraceae bacterium]|nr:efflux RND transporter periplasmic adaptor subunit [Xanthobacteraceae bacterium]
VSVVVSSQVSGQVKTILADHNDIIREGQPIALLDPELFDTRVEQARAEVDVAREAVRIAQNEVATAEVAVKKALADREKTEADSKRYDVMVELTRQRLERKSVLGKSGAVSTSETDDARAAYEAALADSNSVAAQIASHGAAVEQAQAQLAVVRSHIAHSEAQVRRTQAALHQAQADLDRTVIRAPMDGLVIDRSISAGQTVAASFQAPTLFTIGDLRSVNVEIAVDEADIGGLRVGQNVTFSVDAYADKIFSGRITQIRKSPHIQESVVTYTVVAASNNDDLLLFPGMTAKADIITRDIPDALQVPSAALRYHPRGFPQPTASSIWVLAGDHISPVAVRVGATNEGVTELVSDNLSEGQRVVVGDVDERAGGLQAVQVLRAKIASWIEPFQAAMAGLADH